MRKEKEKTRIYTKHGTKRNQGLLAVVNGEPVLAYTEGNEKTITGYTTLQELIVLAATNQLPQYQLDF